MSEHDTQPVEFLSHRKDLSDQIAILGVTLASVCLHLKEQDPTLARKIYDEALPIMDDIPKPLGRNAQNLIALLKTALLNEGDHE